MVQLSDLSSTATHRCLEQSGSFAISCRKTVRSLLEVQLLRPRPKMRPTTETQLTISWTSIQENKTLEEFYYLTMRIQYPATPLPITEHQWHDNRRRQSRRSSSTSLRSSRRTLCWYEVPMVTNVQSTSTRESRRCPCIW